MEPVAENAEADEVLALDVDVARGEGAAGSAEVRRRHLLLLLLQLLVDGVLDR